MRFLVADVEKMIKHWLATPPNGYLGFSYARNLKELLFHPLDEDRADTLLYWLKEDIPILKTLSDSDLSIVCETIDIDKKQYYIQIGQVLIEIEDNQGASNSALNQGTYYDANAQ